MIYVIHIQIIVLVDHIEYLLENSSNDRNRYHQCSPIAVQIHWQFIYQIFNLLIGSYNFYSFDKLVSALRQSN